MNHLLKSAAMCALLASIGIEMPARASEPTPEQLADFSHLFGFDRLISSTIHLGMPGMMAGLSELVAENKVLADGLLPAHVHDQLAMCARREWNSVLSDAVHSGLRQQLKTGEVIEAWKQFAATEAGIQYMAHMGQVMDKQSHDAEPQAMSQYTDAWLESLPVQWREAIFIFMKSPEGQAYFGNTFQMPQSSVDMVVQRLVRVCVPNARAQLPDAS